MNTHPIVLIIGTRPEGIKMAPVYHALKKANLPVVIISTLQHDQLLRDVLKVFDVTPDFELNIMRLGQDLFYITQSVLQKTKEIYKQINPAFVLVQGDTTSSMAAALSAFYLHIPVGHIEAGLRTDDIHEPFPEEMNRRVISTIAKYHFAPTQTALENLLAHGIHHSKVFNTGNTVVDALRIIKEKINSGVCSIDSTICKQVTLAKKQHKKIMLLTAHRRESFNGGIEQILQTVKNELQNNDDLICFYPYHPNPHVS